MDLLRSTTTRRAPTTQPMAHLRSPATRQVRSTQPLDSWRSSKTRRAKGTPPLEALRSTTTQQAPNVASGNNSLQNNSTGSYNVGTGHYALANNSTGSNNIAIGYYRAGFNLGVGNSNIFIANEGAVVGDSGVIRIGTSGQQVSTYVAGIYNVPVTGSAVCISSVGQLGICGTPTASNPGIHNTRNNRLLIQQVASLRSENQQLRQQLTTLQAQQEQMLKAVSARLNDLERAVQVNGKSPQAPATVLTALPSSSR
jgi:hypothetical protein